MMKNLTGNIDAYRVSLLIKYNDLYKCRADHREAWTFIFVLYMIADFINNL
jgi:hypothetical protein